MCGILTIINKKANDIATSNDLIKACSIIRHRGPDDEGFLTWNRDEEPQLWFGNDTASSTRSFWPYQQLRDNAQFTVGLAHRRLSILDLSPAGHQPMLFRDAGLAISFNGEVYNYLEIKSELEQLGHQFVSKTDTEVILHAWAEWGTDCLDRFNGMFAFVLLDYRSNCLYAVRDRFGVKPLYYYNHDDAIIFSSEIKQIKSFKIFRPQLNDHIAMQYLATGAVDHTSETFDVNINHLPGGHYIRIDLSQKLVAFEIHQWYNLKPVSWNGTWRDATDQFKNLLIDSIKLRLRSDVTVGSCLSGGLDSSSIVCLASELLKANGEFAGQETVTACYKDLQFDEWKFAEQVINKTKARSHKIFPEFKDLKGDLESFLWHQDEPTGSTSQFSQWSVFKKAHDAGLKVMIDGQGADEQLAGYGGNDLPLYTGLIRKANFIALFNESINYRKQNGQLPVGFLLGAVQILGGKNFSALLPKRLRLNSHIDTNWLKCDRNFDLYKSHALSLQENLLRQVYCEPLPSLLRYEDRNSMAWSVESRTPFMDYRLLEFTLGLPERYVYNNGTRKHILRNAMKDTLPDAITNRRDKMGFVTPEEKWLKGEGKNWFMEGVNEVIELVPEYFNKKETIQHFENMVSGKLAFNFSIWRIVSFGQWYKKQVQDFSYSKFQSPVS